MSFLGPSMRVVLISQYFHPEQFSNNAIARSLVAGVYEVYAVPWVLNYLSGVFFAGYSNREGRSEGWEAKGYTTRRRSLGVVQN